MGQASQRGTLEQRIALANQRDAILREMFADKDHTATVVRDAVRLIPMTPERLKTLADRSKLVVPG